MQKRFIAVTLAGLSSSCGFITAGAASAASDDASASNAPAAITGFAVEDAKAEPARIRFVLADAESNAIEVELLYDAPDPDGAGQLEAVVGARLEHMEQGGASVANPLVLDTSPQGKEHSFDWFFTREAGIPSSGKFTTGVQVYARVAGGVQAITLGANAALLGIGNDPPAIVTDGAGFADADLPSEEVVGLVRVTFLVADSSLDQVDLSVEYAIADGIDVDSGELPDASAFHAATPDGQPPKSIQTTEDGTSVDFFWNPLADLGRTEHDVIFRITPNDLDEQGNPLGIGAPVLTRRFRIDNNAAPIIQFDSGALLANPDERRGIPIPYRVIDEESDQVEVIFQWRREGEAYPPLPTENASLDVILADPDLRREHHICTEAPRYARGRAIPIDETTVRFPELAQQESWIVARGLVGGTLELLRASQFLESSWATNPLDTPVAALPLGDGLTALVLDGTGNGGWRVREIELATGEVLSELATGGGTPTAMALTRREKTLFVASSNGQWTVNRFDLAGGAAVPSGSIVGTSASPDGIRGLAATSPSTALATVDDNLSRLNFAAVPSSSVPLFTGLGEPWGVVADPLEVEHAYVALRTEHRVVHVDLATRALTTVPAEILGSTGLPLPNPRALALERNGARLLTVVQRLGGKVLLRGLDLRSAPDWDGDAVGDSAVFVLAEDFDERASIATGVAALRVMALPSTNGVAISGGVEQRRTIAAYESVEQRLCVERPFAPIHGATGACRLTGSVRGSPIGTPTAFLWDTSIDLPGGGSTLLRAIARDSEAGSFAQGVARKRVRAALDSAPLTLAGSGIGTLSDLDGDGDLDLVSANSFGNDLTVFLQSSPGSFDRAPFTLGGTGTTDSPQFVSAADLDGDGDLDLVSANGDSSNLTVFFQSSPGSFDPAPLTLGGTGTTDSPASVSAADLNGDGDLDLVSANVVGNDLTVFFQRSPGSFDPAPLVLGGIHGPRSVAATDVDQDGDLDLVSANGRFQFGHNLTVFFQSSPGIFDPVPLVLGGPGTTDLPLSVAAADLDGDGDLDLVSANFGGNLTVFSQGSPGKFDPAPLVLGGPGTTDFARSVAAADLDGDGDLDLVSANNFGNDLTVFFQSSPGSFDPAPLVLGAANGGSVAAADVDGDGDLDLVNFGAVFFQSSPGSFDPSPLVIGGPGRTDNPRSVAAADLDGDGELDLLSANAGPGGASGNLTMFFQSSPGSFDPSPLVVADPVTTGFAQSVATADVDGDGDLDLVSASPHHNSNDLMSVFFQDSPGTFDPAPLVLSGRVTTGDPQPVAVAAADIDGDGDVDLVSANADSSNLTVFFQGAPGSFGPAPLVLGGPATTFRPQSVAAADLDGDGDLDLASANAGFNGGSLTVFFQSSAGAFGPVPLTLGNIGAMTDPRSVAAADLDEDGDLDLVSANWGPVGFSSKLTVFFQRSPGSFDPTPLVLSGSVTTDDQQTVVVAAADLDRDGDVDLVLTDSGSSTLSLFFQRSPGSFDPAPPTLGGPGTTDFPRSVAAADLDGDGEIDLVSANVEDLTVFFGGGQ